MLKLSDPVTNLHLLSASSAKALRRLGIRTIRDLLAHFPRKWQDLSDIRSVENIEPEEKISVRAKVKSITSKHTRWKKRSITEALLEDETDSIMAVWFNQPYLRKQLTKGKDYYFHGKAVLYDNALQLQHPTFEAVKEETIHTAGIVPHYELTAGITQKQTRYWIKQAQETSGQITEYLPQKLLEKYGYPQLSRAIRQIHFPENKTRLKAARQRLAFGELFLFQLAFTSFKKKLKSLPAPKIPFNQKLIKNFVASLPFQLTRSQRLTIWEILQDLEKPHPMNRLLEGDVGSGKTVVAGVAALQTAKAGYQTVILAPTEILAVQHYETLNELFDKHELNIALLTRSHKQGSGPTADIVVGTHALLQDTVRFENIGLLVIDEQHRFGVKQRARLQKQGKQIVPHLLSMTATPIPRSLALAFYGDLDISQLKELPKGRKKIITRLAAPENRHQAYEFIKKQIQNGRQAYVVVPLIGEPRTDAEQTQTNADEKKTVLTETKKLQKLFPDFSIRSLHGRMKGEEKRRIMDNFKSGQTDILVSTTVIEVGVDVPRATIMMIENAERFGLATLHQLRGRVGRSDQQSYCFLFAETAGEETLERLQAVVDSTDGFALAEKDLELRGPGEILGTKQSGYVPFKIAKLTDTKLTKKAQTEAKKLLDADPKLKSFPGLKHKVEQLIKNIHLE